jgi:hypothetical protein
MGLKYFIDNDLSPKLARALRDNGHGNIEHLQDTFSEDTQDEEWLDYVGKNGLILITKDKGIRRNPKEKEALLHYKIIAFYLGGKEMGSKEILRQCVVAWDKIEAKAKIWKKKGVAAAFRVRRNGGNIDDIQLT